MKIAAVIAKILAALATVVGAIYLLATYGEQIVAWCKKVMASLPEITFENDEAEPEVEEEADEAPAAAPVVENEDEAIEDVVVVEVPVVDAPAADEVVADEADFVQE